MDDHNSCCELIEFRYLQGVDLTLWVQLIVGVLLAAVAAATTAALLG
jgi:hypothetical protein